jgi:hypothetical protein
VGCPARWPDARRGAGPISIDRANPRLRRGESLPVNFDADEAQPKFQRRRSGGAAAHEWIYDQIAGLAEVLNQLGRTTTWILPPVWIPGLCRTPPTP